MKKNFTSPDWKASLPVPVCENHPEYLDFYYKTWEIARSHVKNVPGMPQNPYMDESLCDTQVWIWDTCFMAQFCKFAQNVFPGVETFDNFYEVLHGEKSLPKIVPSENEPKWTHATPGVPNDIYIHIADNPPLFAWGEYENALYSGDREHLRELLYEKKYLQKHFAWFESLKAPVTPKGVFLPTCLVSEDIGYRWEGGRSGMDNTPRGRAAVRDGKERPDQTNLLWIDAICQQSLSAKMLSKLFDILGDSENSDVWKSEFEKKKEIINSYYWDEKDSFYYDIDINTHDFYRVMTVASYWALTSGVATKERAEALAKRLDEPSTFGGDVPLISLARCDGDYFPDGRYWRGGLWLPTAYAALKGLSDYGFDEKVHVAAKKILDHMLATYIEYEPHTVWECYSPEAHAPANSTKSDKISRPNFCGWSALGPISIYIEYVLGFKRVDAFEKKVYWVYPHGICGEVGIKNLSFGDILTDITAKNGVCKVISSGDYTLNVDGKDFYVKSGENIFTV